MSRQIREWAVEARTPIDRRLMGWQMEDAPLALFTDQPIAARRYTLQGARAVVSRIINRRPEAVNFLRIERVPLHTSSGWIHLYAAPRDGSHVLLRVVHPNARCSEDPWIEGWIAACPGHWTDFNGGGWVWSGLAGEITHWKPAQAPETED